METADPSGYSMILFKKTIASVASSGDTTPEQGAEITPTPDFRTSRSR